MSWDGCRLGRSYVALSLRLVEPLIVQIGLLLFDRARFERPVGVAPNHFDDVPPELRLDRLAVFPLFHGPGPLYKLFDEVGAFSGEPFDQAAVGLLTVIDVVDLLGRLCVRQFGEIRAVLKLLQDFLRAHRVVHHWPTRRSRGIGENVLHANLLHLGKHFACR